MKKICFAFIMLISLNIYPEENAVFRDKQKKFIRELFESGRYFDCIGETEKLNRSGKNPAAEYFIYTCYFLGGQYATVINNYTPGPEYDEKSFHSLLLLSGSYLKKGAYDKSYSTLKDIDYNGLDEKNRFTKFLRTVEPLVLSEEDEKIDTEINHAGIFLKDNYNFAMLRDELQLYRKDGVKSPLCASIMSAAVPGLGQCYSGYFFEGTISFLSVAATAAGGFYMKEQGRKSLSYAIFGFSGLFYAGNIYGAYNSAVSANREIVTARHRSITSHFGDYNPADYIVFERVFD